jgi:hypothetical protein
LELFHAFPLRFILEDGDLGRRAVGPGVPGSARTSAPFATFRTHVLMTPLEVVEGIALAYVGKLPCRDPVRMEAPVALRHPTESEVPIRNSATRVARDVQHCVQLTKAVPQTFCETRCQTTFIDVLNVHVYLIIIRYTCTFKTFERAIEQTPKGTGKPEGMMRWKRTWKS